MIWDDEGGLSGFLNLRTKAEGRPFFFDLGGPKSIAKGVPTKRSQVTRFGDLKGDGKIDYLILDADTGAVDLWQNQGSADASVAGDGIHFAEYVITGLHRRTN